MAPRAVIILVNYQCNSEVENGDDSLKSALFRAAQKPENIEALKVILRSVFFSCSTVLHFFSFFFQQTLQTCIKLISELCEFLICYHSRDDDGNTPLHTSARYGNLQAVEVFLEWQRKNQGEERAELVCNNEGKTSAHLAAEFDNPR